MLFTCGAYLAKSRLELCFHSERGKRQGSAGILAQNEVHRERVGILVQNEVHSEKYSNKAVQTDNSRAVRLVVSLSLNFTTRQTARELRLTAALCQIADVRAMGSEL